MAYVMYGNSGGIDEVIKLLKHPKETFESINDMFDNLVKTRESISDKRDLFIGYYGYDSRIQKDVYIITCAKSGNEDYMRKYHWPQFVSYAVELKKRLMKKNESLEASTVETYILIIQQKDMLLRLIYWPWSIW